MTDEPTVLIVDDDAIVRDLLAHIFNNAGIPVHTFGSARDLLTRGDLRSRCVLLLDVKMPDMSGPELQMVLRERGIGLPIIFLSGVLDVPVVVDAMRHGARDFLVKPFDSATLIDRVRETFARYYTLECPLPAFEYSRRLVTLTPREREVFDLMVTGVSSKHIARALDCSFRTIDIHRGRVMSKMAARTLAQLVRMNLEPHGPPDDLRT